MLAALVLSVLVHLAVIIRIPIHLKKEKDDTQHGSIPTELDGRLAPQPRPRPSPPRAPPVVRESRPAPAQPSPPPPRSARPAAPQRPPVLALKEPARAAPVAPTPP